MSSLELARRYGIGKTSVLRLLDAHHIARRHQAMTPEQIATAIQMYESGLSVALVAEQLNVAGRTVQRALQQAQVARRDTRGRPRRG